LAAAALASDGDQYLGSWAGTWSGQDGSSGHFTLKGTFAARRQLEDREKLI
jgi:hypothetical protein